MSDSTTDSRHASSDSHSRGEIHGDSLAVSLLEGDPGLGPDTRNAADAELQPGESPQLNESQPKPDSGRDEEVGWIRRACRLVGGVLTGLFSIASLVVLLAVLAAIPIVQLITFGYLLDASGRLASGGKLRESLPHVRAAGTIGLVIAAMLLASLPVGLLTHWESVAELISPGSSQAGMLRIAAIAAAVSGLVYVLWAMARGGSLWAFLWPQPLRFLRQGWRPSTYRELPDRLWRFTGSLELWRFFSLGLRGALGTLVWLIPAMLIIAANRNGETGLAGLVGGLALIMLGIVLLYLPMLQVHFAAENRLAALFQVGRIRRLFCYAPWSWLAAMVCGLVLLPIPLYLLKIEATPQEVVWLPTLVFVSFILPARLAEGLAMRRARRIALDYGDGRMKPGGFMRVVSRWAVRILMPGVVAVYLLFLTLSQYTSWDGLQTWVQQHAVLMPIPFLNGV
ncbi:DUF4013 domain-containing protein [Roseiconus nitratireducens]|uniref:DUF4013 domain-containing protein n=1 Tax=Roseiconus nitratireducens TaxID=2605748 RepID=A0A5M6DGZ9_9BACT|nr:DUF4013 domain-containing protein [Roseiconus nitratireducens]KAA5545550.1 DUF4013 domain-containing protein [Roseiconus nitratireducens]